MSKPQHLKAKDLLGYSRLAIDATLGVTGIVEAMHHTISRRPHVLGETPAGRPSGITGLVYSSIRGITRGVGGAISTVLAPFARQAESAPTSDAREVIVGVLNGIFGDHLEASGNPLAIRMHFQHSGRVLEPGAAPAGRRLLILAHGLCMNPRQWIREPDQHDHGRELARELGLVPIHLAYNSGRAIADNGRELCALLEQLLNDWPEPVEQLHLLGHSMGGLVLRSACHQAGQYGAKWLQRVASLSFLGSPHHGAPLERGGHGVDLLLGASPYLKPLARLGQARSAGIMDLRHGRVHGTPEPGPAPPPPLPAAIPAFTIAATKGAAAGSSLRERLYGDGLVPVASALGRHPNTEFELNFSPDNQHIAYGIDHFGLLGSAEVYQRLLGWLRPLVPPASA